MTPLVIGIVGVAFFSACAVGGYMAHQYRPALLLLCFVLPPAFVCRLAGTITITPEAVTHRSLYGTFRLEWHCVTDIEVGNSDGTLVLRGDGRRLVLAPPTMWSGSQLLQAQALFATKVQELGITTYRCSAAAYKTNRNVRVFRRGGS